MPCICFYLPNSIPNSIDFNLKITVISMSSSVGYRSAKCSVYLISAPNVTISSLVAGHTTSTSIQFYWSGIVRCIGRNGPTRGFHYYLLDGTTQVKEEYTPESSVDLKDLTPFKDYTFKVAFCTWVGDGPQQTKVVKTSDSGNLVPMSGNGCAYQIL